MLKHFLFIIIAISTTKLQSQNIIPIDSTGTKGFVLIGNNVRFGIYQKLSNDGETGSAYAIENRPRVGYFVCNKLMIGISYISRLSLATKSTPAYKHQDGIEGFVRFFYKNRRRGGMFIEGSFINGDFYGGGPSGEFIPLYRTFNYATLGWGFYIRLKKHPQFVFDADFKYRQNLNTKQYLDSQPQITAGVNYFFKSNVRLKKRYKHITE